MSMFTLDISCLTTSNLPWVMDLTFQVSTQYCSLQHQTLLPSPHPQLGVVFALALSGVISPLFSSTILGTYQPGEFILQCHNFLPFHTVMGFLRQEYWMVCDSLLQWTTFCHNSPPWPGVPFYFTVSDFTFTTRHIQNWVLFLLWLNLFILSGAISLLFSSSILGI